MKRNLFLLCFILSPLFLFAQQFSLKGIVVSDAGEPIEFATVALMNPKDTTLENFAFTDGTGNFEIKNVVPAPYLFQVSFIGFETYDTLMTAPPAGGSNLGIFVLRTAVTTLDAVHVTAERTPLQIKGDTIEYNAGAFKTQPDATVEDLLKKLPGVEVDEAGNIKAQGEQVQQVLVDGKEFFSSDPAVATKNLPADAIDKVQVYDRSSEEAEFTGVDDGQRNKTINLMLKDGKKSMWLGNAQAGYGTENTYQANAKVYRFTKENQFAAMGMLNNINQFGFSINDYIDFNGGIGSMMSGDGFRIETGDSDQMPVNFGGQVDGLITSGAGGLNFTHEAVPGNRFNVSYLGNGYQKDLLQKSVIQNFTPAFDYITNDSLQQATENYYHRLNFNVRNKPDSMQNIIATGNASLNYGNQSGDQVIENYHSDSLTNALNSLTYDQSNSLRANAELMYIHKLNSDWRFIKTAASVSGRTSLSETNWNNLTQFFDTGSTIQDDAFRDKRGLQADYALTLSSLRRMNNGFYFEPTLTGGGTWEQLNRRQGSLTDEEIPVDSLSPEFSRRNIWAKPGVAIKYSSKKTNWKITLAGKDMVMNHTLNGIASADKNYLYFVPSGYFEKEIKQGRHIRFAYESEITAPTAIQLLPVTDDINPLALYTGNADLKPEYSHSLHFNWMLFDQFSFTSLFTHLNATYTKDKINYAKTIHADLTESLTLVNTPSDYTASAGFDFSTPIRPVKLNIRLSFEERFNRGINYVNAEENSIRAFTHEAKLRFDNRKKDKWEINFGTGIEYTQAQYSIQELQNSNYLTNSLFFDVDYSPADAWRFSFDADIDRYEVKGFEEATTVPLLQAEITRYFLKSNRGTISLKGYDLLNKNTGVRQSSAYNYLQTTTSNTIGRYVMLSFKYRINKTEVKSGVDIEINGE